MENKILLVPIIMAVLMAGVVIATNYNLTLKLYQKNITDWTIVKDGSWGTMTYGEFDFKGHSLPKWTEYTLIRYTDPWETHKAVCLGSGKTSYAGNIHIEGVLKNGGPKIWLVLSKDVNCTTEKMTAWNGAKYLFENNLI